LMIGYEGDGQIYSTLITDTFHTDVNAAPVQNGMRVTREYEASKGLGYTLSLGDTVTVRLTIDGLKAGENYGVIRDDLPAGLVPINPSFKNEQSETDNRYFWQWGVNGYDITENGIVISLDQLANGSNTYTYRARVVNAGKFTIPPATAQLMYSPEVNGRTGTEIITVDTEAKFDPAKAARLSRLVQSGKELAKRPGWQYILLVGAGLLVLAGLGYGGYRLYKKKKTPPGTPSLTPPPPTVPPVSV